MTRPLRAPILLALTLFVLQPVGAQTTVIRGAEVHTVSDGVIENGMVVIRNGRITAVGPVSEVISPDDARVLDARGKILTPGLIDVATGLGLVEVSSVSSTNDRRSDGDAIRAAFRVLDGINPNSVLIPVARRGGVTTVGSIPSGGIISGQVSVVDLSGETVDDMLVSESAAMVASFNPFAASSVGGSRGALALRLRESLEDAAFYRARMEDFNQGATRNLGLSRLDAYALQPVLERQIPMIFNASRASDIDAALRLSSEFGIQPVILGGEEAWLRADKLAAANIPVIVKPLSNSPTQFDRLGTRFDNAALLAGAGNRVVISTMDAHNVASLRFEAGNAVRFGMDWENALRSVTLEAAQLLGIEESHGSIEEGKRANLVIWSGDPFQFSTTPEFVFVRGVDVPLTSRRQKLLERYRTIDDGPPQYKNPE